MGGRGEEGHGHCDQHYVDWNLEERAILLLQKCGGIGWGNDTADVRDSIMTWTMASARRSFVPSSSLPISSSLCPCPDYGNVSLLIRFFPFRVEMSNVDRILHHTIDIYKRKRKSLKVSRGNFSNISRSNEPLWL